MARDATAPYGSDIVYRDRLMRLLISVPAAALVAFGASGVGAQTAPPPAPPPAAPPGSRAPATGTMAAPSSPSAPSNAAQGADPFATPPPIAGTPGAVAGTDMFDAPVQRDPLEKFNRGVWGFNQGVDRYALKPVAQAYRFVTPRPVRRGIGHIFANLSEPWSFINNLLQGKVGRAMNNLGRFVVNTTIGVGGLADNASKLGIKPADEDFGQTLAVWGAKNSPYLVLPLFGPSTVRDGIGTAVAYFADPYPICLKECTNLKWRYRFGIQAVHVINTRSDLIDSGADAFLESSLDPYASARSAYLQSRAAEIADQDQAEGAAAKPGNVDPTMPASKPAAPPASTSPVPPAADPFATPPPLSKEPSAAIAPPAAPELSLTMPTSEG